MMGLMDIFILRINKSLMDKVILMLLFMRMKGFVILDLKGRTLSIDGALSLCVVRDMRVDV